MVYNTAEAADKEVTVVSCVIAAMSSDKGLQAVTFKRVKEETDKDQHLVTFCPMRGQEGCQTV